MDTKLKNQLLAAMKAYMHSNNGDCCCETCNAQAEADDDKGLKPRKSYDDCPVNKGMFDALAALEAAPVDDLAEKFAEAHAAISPLLGDTCLLTLNHIAARYSHSDMEVEWRVMAGKKGTLDWHSGGDRREFSESLRELIKDIQKPSTTCETCGQKNVGIYAHIHVEVTA